MKMFLFLCLFILSLPVFASNEMRLFIEITDGSIYAGQVPRGYRSVKLSNSPSQSGFTSFMSMTTKLKQKIWANHVHTSGEFKNLTLAKRREIAANPLAELEVKALLEVEEVYAIYKGNKLIGHFVKLSDHVQAAIYQDGAWYDVFFDAQFNLVAAFDQSA
jgi:hypothetical protein